MKSILCIPVWNQEKFAGVLYLHNNRYQDAFPPQRVKLLEVLTTQIAISLENAFMMQELQRTADELRKNNQVR